MRRKGVAFKILISLLILILLTYGTLLTCVYRFQRRLQYFPTHRDAEGRGSSLFSPWKSSSGKFLGYMRKPSGLSRGAILFFHGNGGEAIDREWLAELVLPSYHLFLAEYPGYGANPGEATEAAIFQFAETQLSAVHEVSQLPITLVGESLGTGVASYVASQPFVVKLILISPFTSALDVARLAYPFLPVSLLMKDRFESSRYLAPVKVPLMVIHGTNDDVVPISLGRELFEKFAGPKRLLEIPGASHNDMVYYLLRGQAMAAFRDFLTSRN